MFHAPAQYNLTNLLFRRIFHFTFPLSKLWIYLDRGTQNAVDAHQSWCTTVHYCPAGQQPHSHERLLCSSSGRDECRGKYDESSAGAPAGHLQRTQASCLPRPVGSLAFGTSLPRCTSSAAPCCACSSCLAPYTQYSATYPCPAPSWPPPPPP